MQAAKTQKPSRGQPRGGNRLNLKRGEAFRVRGERQLRCTSFAWASAVGTLGGILGLAVGLLEVCVFVFLAAPSDTALSCVALDPRVCPLSCTNQLPP